MGVTSYEIYSTHSSSCDADNPDRNYKPSWFTRFDKASALSLCSL